MYLRYYKAFPSSTLRSPSLSVFRRSPPLFKSNVQQSPYDHHSSVVPEMLKPVNIEDVTYDDIEELKAKAKLKEYIVVVGTWSDVERFVIRIRQYKYVQKDRFSMLIYLF